MRVFVNSCGLSWIVGQTRESSWQLSWKIWAGSNSTKAHESRWERTRVSGQTRTRVWTLIKSHPHSARALYTVNAVVLVNTIFHVCYYVHCIYPVGLLHCSVHGERPWPYRIGKNNVTVEPRPTTTLLIRSALMACWWSELTGFHSTRGPVLIHW